MLLKKRRIFYPVKTEMFFSIQFRNWKTVKQKMENFSMKILWTNSAWQDYLYWQSTDKTKIKRINELIKTTQGDPFQGIGNPEALKHDLQGFWSRRLDGEHRFVYKIANETLQIVACRYHY